MKPETFVHRLYDIIDGIPEHDESGDYISYDTRAGAVMRSALFEMAVRANNPALLDTVIANISNEFPVGGAL